MSEKIKFIYHNRMVYEMAKEQENTAPSSAKNFIPDWYKKMHPYNPSQENPDGKKILVRDKASNASAKKCTPMLDGLTSGYTVPLWCDVQISQQKNNEDGNFYPFINWRTELDVFSLHTNDSTLKVPPPIGYDSIVFKFITWFRIETPKGYSLIVQKPSGYNDLPFHAVPAVIDSDKSVIDSNFPCWIRSGFEGVVEKGTPIAQIIPFKRTNWKKEFSQISYEDHSINVEKNFNSNIRNNYIKNIWSKKEYK
jgi:hypothetical protein